MAKQLKTVKRGMLEASAASVRDAKQQLEDAVDAALQGDYEPRLVAYGPYAAFVYRTPHGWAYRIVTPANGIQTVYACSGPTPDLDSVTQDAAFHVIDIGAKEDEFHSADDVPGFLTNERLRRTVVSNQRFRRAYAWYAKNHTEAHSQACHQWACENSQDERFR
jgi:hypothetical protein